MLDIAYTEHGGSSGPPVLLLHGWPDAARGWLPIAGELAGAGWRVIVPDNRGTGDTRFAAADTVRAGPAAALIEDALALADALGLDQFAVVGHDWGARVAYGLAAVVPDRLSAIAALALPYQSRGEFVMPGFSQARAFWYQWLMCVDAGADAIRRDPIGFARQQWDTWSPAGWFDDAEFAATAEAFTNPDWAAITLNGYRGRFRTDEPRDHRYDPVREQIATIDHLTVPTLMIQGGSDFCDEPAGSAGLEDHFDTYRRVVLDGVGHFPHREAPDQVAVLLLEHFSPG
jgi:pimeloyl-ACP methyl ester carboxylesterase